MKIKNLENILLLRNKLIFSNIISSYSMVINYLDVGARGDISSPWSLFESSRLKIIGFEPDSVECDRLANKFPERKYYPEALWSHEAQQTFYLCEWESTSSMYPPNIQYNTQFEKKHWEGRVVKEKFLVKCVALDSVVVEEDIPDFIKIDTQGAELEILKGSERILKNNAPLVLVETWCSEVYQGIPMSHEILDYMNHLGYQVFDYNLAAAWKNSNSYVNEVKSKPKVIGFDFLFVKRAERITSLTEAQMIKLVSLCELYGFRDYSFYLIENTNFLGGDLKTEILNKLIKNNNIESSAKYKLISRLIRLFGRILGINIIYSPQLH